MSFAAPAWLAGLLLVPVLLWAYVAARAHSTRYAARFPAASTLALAAAQAESRWRRHLPGALLLCACVLLVLALARPQRSVRTPVGSASVMLVLDHSGSMQATDVRPTRLAAAERAARAFVAELPSQVRVGVVAFSSVPDAVQPPSTDRRAVLGIVEDQSAVGSTATGSALALALNLLESSEDPPGHRATPGAIVLLSDGAANAGRDPVEVAAEAGARRIPVYTVALGNADATIPNPTGAGPPVAVPPDPELLQRIARASHGQSFTAQDSGGLISIYRRLGEQLGSVRRFRDTTVAFALAGAALLLGAGLLALRRGGGCRRGSEARVGAPRQEPRQEPLCDESIHSRATERLHECARRGRVVRARIIQSGAQGSAEILADQTGVQRARHLQCHVGPGRGCRDQQTARGERLELDQPVVLAAGSADEDAGAPQQALHLRGGDWTDDLDVLIGQLESGLVQPLARDAHDEQPLAAAADSPPRRQHAVQPLLVGIARVGDRGDVALGVRSCFFLGALPRAREFDRRRQHERVLGATGHREGGLGEPSLAPGQQQRSLAQAAALERTLPEPVATGTIRGGGGVEADRPPERPEQRRGRARVDHRPGAQPRRAPDDPQGAAPRGAGPQQVGEGERPHLPRIRGLDRGDARARALERVRQLRVGSAQTGRGAEPDEQHVDLLDDRLSHAVALRSRRRRSVRAAEP